MSPKARVLAMIADRIKAAEAAGLKATTKHWREYYANVEARSEEEIWGEKDGTTTEA